MFAKLLKHEWKSCSKILGILSLAMLGVAVLIGIMARMLGAIDTTSSDETEGLMIVFAMLLYFLLMATIFAYTVASLILLLYRFYKNKFSDEGYLTFTLPVNSRQIFLASFLNMAAWMVIVCMVVIATLLIIGLIGTPGPGIINTDFIEEIAETFSMIMSTEYIGEFVFVGLLNTVAGGIYYLVLLMTSITVGAVIAKKHKLLAAFGIYYGISMAAGIVSTIMMAIFMIGNISSDFNNDMMNAYTYMIVIELALAVGGFFLSTHLMDKKLNLP